MDASPQSPGIFLGMAPWFNAYGQPCGSGVITMAAKPPATPAMHHSVTALVLLFRPESALVLNWN